MFYIRTSNIVICIIVSENNNPFILQKHNLPLWFAYKTFFAYVNVELKLFNLDCILLYFTSHKYFNVLYSDEYTFMYEGKINKYNAHYVFFIATLKTL